jgi:hypothetical protein
MKSKFKKFLYLLLILFGLLFFIYLIKPAPFDFPTPPPDAKQSMEDADIESPLRRAYFTNYTREQVIAHYKNQFRMQALTLRLNYPPEDAQTIIRDQTRSYYLEELTHPFRESLYINGFTPQVAKDDIWYKGVHYEAKITIKYVPSSLVIRIIFAILTIGIMFWMIHEYV